MDPQFLYELTQRYSARTFAFLTDLDKAIAPERGKPLLPSRVLALGCICLGNEPGPKTITHLARMMARASQGQLRMLYGVPQAPAHHPGARLEPPSEDQLYHLFDAVSTAQGRGHWLRKRDKEKNRRVPAPVRKIWEKRLKAMRELLGTDNDLDTQILTGIELLRDTTPLGAAGAELTVDTTEIEADCKKISQARLRAGEQASDPDADWRAKTAGERDDDAPGERERREKKGPKRKKKYLGYGDVAVGTTADNAGYVIAHALITANWYDVPVAQRLMQLMMASGYLPMELIGDRGFSQDSAWAAGLRKLGVRGVFDLKDTQVHSYPMLRGCLVLPSGVYLPTLPERLWLLERPGPGAPPEKKRAHREDIEERAIYALVAHGRPKPGRIRLTSPVRRRQKKNALGCPKVPGSLRRRDPALPVCPGDHGDDEACCIKTITLKAEQCPAIFQYPFWDTPEWEDKYAKRTNVERGFSNLKNPDVIGLNKGQFHYRTRPNMSLLTTFMWGAHNLHIWLKRERDAARAAAAMLRKHQRLPRRDSQVAVVLESEQAQIHLPDEESSRAP